MTNPYPITPRQLDLVNLSGSHLTEQGVYPNIKMGVIASYNVSGGSAETVLKSTASGGITLGSLNVQGNSILRNVFPELTDTYDLGTSLKLWRKGWLSELDTILFAQNTITLLGGWLLISKDEGALVGDILATDTTIDFSKSMTVGDFVLMRASLKMEYMQVGAVVSGTIYNVTRNLDGSGANDWAGGTPFAVLGTTGNGRIELNAYDTPRMSIIEQGATYNVQTERIRIGDLVNWQTAGLTGYGMAFGDYAGGEYLTYSPSGGLVVRGTIRADDGYLQNLTVQGLLNLSSSGELRAGDTTNGLRFGYLVDGYYLRGIGGGTTQVEIKASDGKLYAGGGNVMISSTGIQITSVGAWNDPNSVVWKPSASTPYPVYGRLSFSGVDKSSIYGTLMAWNDNTTFNDDAILKLNAETKTSYSTLSLNSYYNNGGTLYLQVSNKLNSSRFEMNIADVGLYINTTSLITPNVWQATSSLFDVKVHTQFSGNIKYSGNAISRKNSTDYTGYIFIPLITPLTSTSWDGDSFSTTAKTLIDLSAVFGAPAGVKAVLMFVAVRDSASQTNDTWIRLSPNSSANVGSAFNSDYVNDRYGRHTATIACDTNGDIYYQISASGTNTLDVFLQILGYWI